MQQEFQTMTKSERQLRTRTSDMIQLDGLQKMKELEVEDRYKVLEFLVKEMMQAKEQDPNVGQRVRVQYNQDIEDSSQNQSRKRQGQDRKQNYT